MKKLCNSKNYPSLTLANNLRRLCEEKHITQKQLAELCGKERKATFSWVNCVSSPSALDLKLICEKYNVSADDLLGLKRKEML